MLYHYMQRVQMLLRDERMVRLNPYDIRSYINEGRREVATRTHSVKALTPISGSVMSGTVTDPGENYTAPVLSISPPDYPSGLAPYPDGLQAMGALQQINGKLSGVIIEAGGSGYYSPVATITDPTGTGGAVSLTTNPINVMAFQQEVYPYSTANLSGFPGFGPVFFVRSVAIIYANYRYTVPLYPFSVYQAQIRQYPFQYVYVPTIGSRYGQGTSSSLYLYPLPSTNYQMEWDCSCLPLDLEDDNSPEVIPDPWTDAIPYYAASLCYIALQNFNSARAMDMKFEQMVPRRTTAARPIRVVNPYGRY